MSATDKCTCGCTKASHFDAAGNDRGHCNGCCDPEDTDAGGNCEHHFLLAKPSAEQYEKRISALVEALNRVQILACGMGGHYGQEIAIVTSNALAAEERTRT